MLRLYVLIFAILSVSAMQAKEPKKHNLSICAIFKNEAPYLQEWLEYHQMIGVDHFYLYNNSSVDAFRKVLSPYIKKKIVTLIQWPDNIGPQSDSKTTWSLSTQLSAYENALKWAALGKTKWLVFLDVDEFLVAPTTSKITDILAQYDEYPGVTLTSEFYDASRRPTLPQRHLVLESLEITAPPAPKLFKAVKKTILKPELCTSFVWPPYECMFADSAQAIKISSRSLRVHQYENRMRFQKINHIKKKLSLDTQSLAEDEKLQYLKAGYELEDQERAVYRYIPELYKKMGYSSPPSANY
jgi:hypothetical protein